MPSDLLLRRLAAPALLLMLGACEPPTPPDPLPEPETLTPAEWLQANAHPIRSLSIADRDFSDLQPLKAAIGDARVVMLGEQTHGDGTTFLAKARLVAFLHQEMGFDVLAWESGMWDLAQAWRHVQAGEDVHEAARRSIYALWMRSEEVLPTFDYVTSTLGTARPLEMAGVDNQFSGTLARDSMHVLTEQFARRIGSAVPDDPEWPAAKETLHELASSLHYETKPTAAEQARLLRLLAALAADAGARPPTDREARFWRQVLAGVDAHARATWASPPNQSNVEASEARDAQMGRNVVWLANVHYPGRKIIVWAASAHIARGVAELTRLNGGQPYRYTWNMRMGAQAHTVLGDDMYTIGFTAGTGTHAPYHLTPTTLEAPLAESMEAYFSQAGLQNAFVDFRAPSAHGEWLRDVQARPFGYIYYRGNWAQVFDGMIYTHVMTPSTHASR
ncbi:erythromycin esterase family protein [Longimicrobium sp.]|uniref:erythromycin esterase family protein n=1 Tax=Longimicrobium sp. TaxID=2029185 RepID=UPI003B3A333F